MARGIDVETFITEQLDRNGLEYKLSKNFIEVSCIFHSHSGKKLKLGFSRMSGGMHCFACKKDGHWNEYAEQLGLLTIDDENRQLQDFAFLKREFAALKDDREPETPEWLEPWTEEWRGLSPEFLATVPSYKWYDEKSKTHRILWPIYVNEKFKGCTAAKADPDEPYVFPKTRNLGGMNSKKILFPFDHELVKKTKALCLVEGQFDALRLLSFGVPAVSIIGAGAWDPYKLTLLAMRGVERLVLAFDGDDAGDRLIDLVTSEAEREFDVRPMYFPDPDDDEREEGIKSIDPGNCKTRYIKLLKRMCKS